MRSDHGKRLVTLHTVRSFVDEHAERLRSVHANPACRQLNAMIEKTHALCVEEEESRWRQLAETQRYQHLRMLLIQDHIAPIIAVARSAMVKDPAGRVFRMPRGNPNAYMLAAVAEGMAQAVAPRADLFIAGGLPADFVARLHAAAGAMLASAVDRDLHRARRYGASTGIATTVRDANTIVRVIGTLVRTEARRDADMLRGWNAIAPRKRDQLSAPPQMKALPAPTTDAAAVAALPAPTVRLLARGATSSEDGSPHESKGTHLLAPLIRLFRAS